ncbi:MAG: hypothetical protein F9K38_08145 [Pseudorhodoplanes sp.]|nr:MAG: hypothetical protein F9K38_08145 [Pseudorhodoplanes sp.]
MADILPVALRAPESIRIFKLSLPASADVLPDRGERWQLFPSGRKLPAVPRRHETSAGPSGLAFSFQRSLQHRAGAVAFGICLRAEQAHTTGANFRPVTREPDPRIRRKEESSQDDELPDQVRQ